MGSHTLVFPSQHPKFQLMLQLPLQLMIYHVTFLNQILFIFLVINYLCIAVVGPPCCCLNEVDIES